MTQVVIVMGSATDRPIAQKAEKILEKFNITFETFVASAHRTPDRVVEIVRNSQADVFIALAGLSAALPGVVAAHTMKPVIGVPCASSSSPANLDSLLSVVQMPPGVPVAGVGIGRGENAALLAARILGICNENIANTLEDYRKELEKKTLDSN
ncbi:MAG TPA: 5-(carboxyamino)imidazole ribonucleotide mutase [Candidatus Poseidoniia archaeon]|jgi:5-(carboxyamino)imidazole ribonucleotide mutase|nr:5-(carboxyamino)imidazole ribonucleotide mutase [Candidatus Poseidoniia archaeon]|tara:strand:+ start:6016 stop:6477 length:462 start_codon:yes stop_codon:yes gene_type:complete